MQNTLKIDAIEQKLKKRDVVISGLPEQQNDAMVIHFDVYYMYTTLA